MAGKTPNKDIMRCLRKIDSLTQGQVTVQDVDASHIEIQISPNSGPYKGGCYNFQVTISMSAKSIYKRQHCKTKAVANGGYDYVQ